MTTTLVHDPLASISEARRGIEERLYGHSGPLMPPTGHDTSPTLRPLWEFMVMGVRHRGDGTIVEHDTNVIYSSCGISWNYKDIKRFLSKCTWHKFVDDGWCLIYHGARSRGKGNKAWYGSFWTKGKTVRAHKFFAVAILGLRPRPNRVDELDHHCFRTRCVSCVQVVPYAVNQKRIRRRKDYAQRFN